MKNFGLALVAAGFLLMVIALFSKNSKTSQKSGYPSSSPDEVSFSATPQSQTKGPPEIEIDVAKKYHVVLETTVGAITIELNPQQTPLTISNFIRLARSGFYNGTIFHRVIKGFMIQGGDPKGDGTGGPGYNFADEEFTGEYRRGTVAMANAGPNTNGSQFFIMHQDYDLEKNYVIFGQVTSGLEIVDKIAGAAVKTSRSGEPSEPVDPVKINSITIREN